MDHHAPKYTALFNTTYVCMTTLYAHMLRWAREHRQSDQSGRMGEAECSKFPTVEAWCLRVI